MPSDTCAVCGNTRSNDPGVSFHRFPANPEKRTVWLHVFQMDEKPYSRACSRQYPGGDAKKDPEKSLAKRFVSPLKKDHPRTKRAKSRESLKGMAGLRMKSPAVSPSSSRSVTPAPSAQSTSQSSCSTQSTVTVKEKLC